MGVVDVPDSRVALSTSSVYPLGVVGAFDLAAPGSATALAVSDPDPQALVVVASKSHRDKATDDYISGRFG